MADVQTENGYTEIANTYLEALASACLSGAEYQIMLVVIRKTWGWKKTSDTISYGQIAELANLHRQTVVKAVKSLVAKRLLLVAKRLPVNTIELQKDYDKWIVAKRLPVAKRLLPSSQTTTNTSSQTTTHKRKKATFTKESCVRFERFWAAYPKKQDKKKTLGKWKKLNPDDALTEIIIAAVGRAAKSNSWKDTQFVPLATTYLNGERWNDEIKSSKTTSNIHAKYGTANFPGVNE